MKGRFDISAITEGKWASTSADKSMQKMSIPISDPWTYRVFFFHTMGSAVVAIGNNHGRKPMNTKVAYHIEADPLSFMLS